MVRLLVCGLLEFDSGKTWTVVGLARYLMERGYNVEVYKPVAGHNLWYSSKGVRYTRKLGILVGDDVATYIEALGVSEPHRVNPIDLALAIPKLRGLDSRSMSEYRLALQSQDKILILARFTDPVTGSTTHYLVVDNLDRIAPSIRKLVEEFTVKLKTQKIELKPLLALLSSRHVAEVLEFGATMLEKQADILIIESFNNVLEPYGGLLSKVDLIIVVAPGYAIVLRDVKTVREIAMKLSQLLGIEGLRTNLVLEKPEVASTAKLVEIEYLGKLGEQVEKLGRYVEEIL
ncbi:MAG TPA: hypothetical protein EYH08_05490 [Pyrodictium sp.]|nr:hypothetical protein [Pyrodictium sp.]